MVNPHDSGRPDISSYTQRRKARQLDRRRAPRTTCVVKDDLRDTGGLGSTAIWFTLVMQAGQSISRVGFRTSVSLDHRNRRIASVG